MTFSAVLFLEGSASLRVPQGRTRLCLFTLCSTGCFPVISVTDTNLLRGAAAETQKQIIHFILSELFVAAGSV